jgi:hypothetical protein
MRLTLSSIAGMLLFFAKIAFSIPRAQAFLMPE